MPPLTLPLELEIGRPVSNEMIFAISSKRLLLTSINEIRASQRFWMVSSAHFPCAIFAF